MIKRARPNRKRNDAARPRPGRTTRWLRILAFVAVLAALGGGIWYGRHSTDVRPAGLMTWADRFFTIHTVEISEGQRVSREEVLALLSAELGADECDDVIGSTDLARLLAAVLPLRQFADVHVDPSGVSARAQCVRRRPEVACKEMRRIHGRAARRALRL